MAKLLVLFALACYAVVSVSCNRAFLKRAEALHQSKRQSTKNFKPCCLPKEFTLKADAVTKTGYGQYVSENSMGIELIYSSSNSALYLSGSSGDMPKLAAVLGISPEEVRVKVSLGSCSYMDYLKFTDNYLLKYIDGEICIPEDIANFEEEGKLGDQDVDVYNIYSLKATTLFPKTETAYFSLKLRAIRRPDDTCIPIQLEGSNNFGRETTMSFELKSLDFSETVDTSKFESAC